MAKTKMTWEQAVSEVREALKHQKQPQLHIVGVALAVCNAKHGGSRDRKGKSVQDFAKAIGMHPSTLHAWITVKRRVYDKLTADLQKVVSYETMRVVDRRINSQTTPAHINQLVRAHSTGNNVETRILKYSDSLRTLMTNLESAETLKALDQKTAEEILYYCVKIQTQIRKVRPGAKPIHHALTSRWRYDDARMGLNGSIVGYYETRRGRLHLKPKEQDIFNIMRSEQKRKWTPTSIGMAGGKTYDNASAWALRGLEKLIATGHVERIAAKRADGSEYDKFKTEYRLTGKDVPVPKEKITTRKARPSERIVEARA